MNAQPATSVYLLSNKPPQMNGLGRAPSDNPGLSTAARPGPREARLHRQTRHVTSPAPAESCWRAAPDRTGHAPAALKTTEGWSSLVRGTFTRPFSHGGLSFFGQLLLPTTGRAALNSGAASDSWWTAACLVARPASSPVLLHGRRAGGDEERPRGRRRPEAGQTARAAGCTSTPDHHCRRPPHR